jgi:hypothetical protein
MRRLIATIAGTTATTLSRICSGWIVIVMAAPGLAALRFARCLLTWLTGATPVGLWVVAMGHMQPAVVVDGGACVRRHYSLRTLRLRLRRMEPGCGASLSES